MINKKIKIEFEMDLSLFEDWCDMTFTEEHIKKIEEYLNDYVNCNLGYKVRDRINDGLLD